MQKELSEGPAVKSITKIASSTSRVNLLKGQNFNKAVVEAPLNMSKTKASFAFSKAKRFSTVTVNETGLANTATKPSHAFTSRNSSGRFLGQQPKSIRPLNMQSGSMQVLDQSMIDGENLDYGQEGEEPMTATVLNHQNFSKQNSLAQLRAGGRNGMGKTLNTEMCHYGGASSLAGTSAIHKQN